MKWTVVSKPSASLKEYHLLEDGNLKVMMKYNPHQHSLRVSCEGRPRLFFFEQGGLRNKTILENEYGVEMGAVNKWNQSGNVEIDNKRYNYKQHYSKSQELVIYQNDIAHPLMVCDLTREQGSVPVPFADKQEAGQEQTCLLLGLCWYLFLHPGEELVQYTTDLSSAV